VYENAIPIKHGVRVACEMLGIDPLEVGNEGKLVIATIPQKADEVLGVLRSNSLGKDAEIVGEATSDFEQVVLQTSVGGRRIILPPVGDPVPRIC
ncbi:hydrogenase expression/formation protein HypE, partial [Candidatus Bathyarchaeota archaeon]|nr:hydrogenase expression/formation protein HypE [Candidatus Bathyarchaeota archaeon]